MPINIKDSIESSTIKGSLNGNASTATKATQDSAGQQINTTYIKGLSVNGKTITYTKGDGTTGTITTQDTNTTYSVGTASALGLTKLYTGTGTATDGTMTQNAINTALNGKANSSHGRHIPDACTTISDWNSATTNGWYMGVNATNAPTSGSNVWYFGEVVAHNTNYVIQTVYQFTASTDAKAIPKYIRAKTNGTWGAWTNVTVAKAVPSNAVFTDTNTWRGVQDNLTSTAKDQSLSANQGKVLKGLIDGKAASNHTHSYVPLANGGNITIHADSDSSSTGEYALIKAGHNELKIASSAGGTTVTKGQDKLTFNGNIVYHAGRKPTISEIGAAAASHTHNYAGSSSAGGNANAAVKLATARTINGTNFDGSANITTANWGTARNLNGVSVNGSTNYTIPVENYYCNVNDNNTNLYHRILTTDIATASWADKSLIIVMHSGYQGGGFGIAKITFRTNDISSAANSQGEIKWLVRNGFAANALVFNFVNQAKNACMDVFYKSPGTYAGMTWYVLSEGGRGGAHSKQWTKYNTNASGTNAYTEANMKTLRTYTSTLVSATDAGHVSTANSANTLATARTINGTSFNGSANITTANWGTARNITIASSDGTGASSAVSVNGSANVTLKLPGTIKATLTGNASTATTLQTARSINGTNFNGSANITTANWGAARTITVGNTGKSVNGSGNVSWSLSEIGALPLTGGTLSGRLTANGRISAPTSGSSWINGMTITNATIGISTQQATGSYHPVLAVKTSGNHVANIGGIGDDFGFYGFKSGRTENGTDWSFKINAGTGAVSSTGNITAPTFVGALSGNASTATTLQTARTINGTSFNGSANITTANWGTARTLTIGKTGKSVNGSGNVSWSLSEIGALPLTGGTVTGETIFNNYLTLNAWSGYGTGTAQMWYDGNSKIVNIQNATGLKVGTNTVYTTGNKPTLADIGHSTYTRSSVGTLDWSDNTGALLTKAAIAHWNGAYSGTSSNLAYCNRGAFGTIVTKNSGDYATASHTHNSIVSRGDVTAESGVAGRPAVSGLSMSQAYSNGYPTPYGNIINLRGTGDGQILVGWSGTDGAHAPIYVRSKRDNTSTANWSPWAELYTTANYAPAPHWGTGNPSNSDGRPNGTVYYKYA